MKDQASVSNFYYYRWWLFSLVSLMFFLITAATFSSFGVALPYMIADLNWRQGEAGVGISLLALTTGLFAHAPALLLRKLGIKATYGIGGLLLATGGALLATVTNLLQYYFAAGLMGLGVCLCATVPGIYLINNWLPDKQSFAIGAFFMIGALGGLAGPFIVTGTVSISGSWHAHWWTMAASLLILSMLATIFLKDHPVSLPEEIKQQLDKLQHSERVHRSDRDWSLGDAMRSHQFYIITLSLTLILLCAITMNSWAFTHITTTALGVSPTIAATVLSLQALVNALSRVLGGSLANFIDPKWLLVSALVADSIGMAALSFGEGPLALTLFIIGDGYGFGMCFFASTMLLVNYYGSKSSPEIIGTMNFITTLAMIGPGMAGMISDEIGGFTWVFRGYAIALLIFMCVVIAMRPPKHHQKQNDNASLPLSIVPEARGS